MGCWTETCFLTNLPILDDSEVVAVEADDVDQFISLLNYSPFTEVSVADGKMGYYGNLTEISDLYLADDKHKFKYVDDNRFIGFCYKDVWKSVVNWCVNDKHIHNSWNERNRVTELDQKLEELAKLIENREYPCPHYINLNQIYYRKNYSLSQDSYIVQGQDFQKTYKEDHNNWICNVAGYLQSGPLIKQKK